jgi:hypothetical protein
MKQKEIFGYLQEITNDHVKSAMRKLDREEIPRRRQSDEYDVIEPDSGKGYPPPLLIETAYTIATGKTLPNDFFNNIGARSPQFQYLKRLGFSIMSKKQYSVEEEIKALIEKSIKLHTLRDSSALFRACEPSNKSIQIALTEQERWKPVDKFEPVVLIRHLILEQIKAGITINNSLIQDLKEKIDKREISLDYKFKTEFYQSLRAYPDKKRSFFHSWKDPFKLIYPFFYSIKEKTEVKLAMEKIAEEIAKQLGLSNHLIHIVGFEGTQNFGEEYVWLALYDKELPNVQESYQLFLRINHDGMEGGLYKGHRISNESFNKKVGVFNTFDEYISFAKTLVDEWKYLNGKLLGKKTLLEDDIHSKNSILYGPPGTGKTYNTLNKSLKILGVDTSKMHRNDITKLFKEKVNEGQIVFTTFHQSMSYEDFIEGIKPQLDNRNDSETADLSYVIENGIFKDLVERIIDAKLFAQSAKSELFIDPKLFDQNVNKISLGNSLDANDDVIYDYCMANDCIVIGFGEDIDFSGVKSKSDIRKRFQDNSFPISDSNDFNVSAIERFVLWMKPGQLVFVSEGKSKLKAIGEVIGDYYCDPSTSIRYSQFRKVKWLYKDLELPIQEIYGKKFSQQTIYQIDPHQIDQSFFSGKFKKEAISNYVLIIDEINRGNVSSIFGELITLLEPDKRKGESEELSVILPYSKKAFSVPSNLYVLGTMNTADRSVEALDTALRRRFTFEEMMPKPELISPSAMFCRLLWDEEKAPWTKKEYIEKEKNLLDFLGASQELWDSRKDIWQQMVKERNYEKLDYFDDYSFDGINLNELLTTINARIEALIDRDHTIGHSFFINVQSMSDLELVFKDKIIPLLQEYFFGDYGKIGLVIGSGFVKRKEPKSELFAEFDYENVGELGYVSYDLIPFKDVDFNAAIQNLIK